MRTITGQLIPELTAVIGSSQTVTKAEPLKVAKFWELMRLVARLSYANKDYLLFFRGQSIDYKNKAQASSFYPSIYRGERLSQDELNLRFDILESASKRLYTAFRQGKVEGASEVERRKLIRWSILQHYEVCSTPLLDFTHSVRVACSFALLDGSKEDPYVFAFGLPYLTNRISVNSEHDLVNVRLLSICPPDALRPYYQEGYLAGTDEITNEYSSKNELDFNNRLIAKFQISRSKDFWDGGFEAIPRKALFPDNDNILNLCREIRQEVAMGAQATELGGFLQAWISLESNIFSLARRGSERIFSVAEAVRTLQRDGLLSLELSNQINEFRIIRNLAVHSPNKIKAGQLANARNEIDNAIKRLKSLNAHNYAD